MSQEEDQAQQQLIQKSIQNSQKNFDDLQKIGEQAAKDAQKDNNSIINNSTSSSTSNMNQSQVSFSTKDVPGYQNGVKFMNVLNLAVGALISIIFMIILMKFTKKRKDKSKIAKLFYNIFRICLGLCVLDFVYKVINNYNHLAATVYESIAICILMIIFIFWLIKRKNKNFEYKIDNNRKIPRIQRNFPTGVIMGALNGKIIVKEESKPGHILVNGGSGKGKTQNVVIPTLLNWNGSSVVVDIKREIYAYTYNVQASKGRVIVFDPEQGGHRYNPIIDCTDVESSLFLARTLCPTPKNAKEPMWTQNAQSILAATCFEGNRKNKTLPEIAERILMTEQKQLVNELLDSEFKEVNLLASCLRDTPDTTMGGVFTELRSNLILLATDPIIRQALSGADWTPEVLEESATIYLRISENKLETYKQVLNLIIVQIIRYLSKRPEHKNPAILMLLDELPRLGRLESYENALPTVRSKNVTIVSPIQSIAQLQEIYGDKVARTIMDNKAYKLVLSASDNETQRVFSELAGKVEKEKVSTNHQYFSSGGVSKHKQWEERFRPETFAYLKRPIFYPPDCEAFEIDKLGWMEIPYLVKLQNSCGGPTGFLSDSEIQRMSTFRNEVNYHQQVNQEVALTEQSESDQKQEKIKLLDKWQTK